MSDKKLIKGLKKVIKKLKPFNDQIMDMGDWDKCALSLTNLWCFDGDNKDQQKTAKKLFGIKTSDYVFEYNFNYDRYLSGNITENQLKVLKLFRYHQDEIKVKKWRKNAKEVLRELENNL